MFKLEIASQVSAYRDDVFLQELTRIDNRIHTKHSVYDGVYH